MSQTTEPTSETQGADQVRQESGAAEPSRPAAAGFFTEVPVMREIGMSKAKQAQELVAKFNNKFVLGGVVIAVLAVLYMGAKSMSAPKAPSPDLLLDAKVEKSDAKAVSLASTNKPQPSAATGASSSQPAVPASEASAKASDAAGQTQEQVAAKASNEQAALLMSRLAAIEEELTLAKARIGELESAVKESQRAQPASAKKQPAGASQKSSGYVAASILEIGVEGVLIAEGGEKVMVRPGGMLPGGSIFLGFDAQASVMRTDQGDIRIQFN